jgi:hypothetical protein
VRNPLISKILRKYDNEQDENSNWN